MYRCGIFTTFPKKDSKKVSQIIEVNLPYYFSKKFNTRVYEDDNSIKIRHYGKLTIGEEFKKVCLFENLRENGYDEEICIDEEGEKYICIIRIKDNCLGPDYLGERLIKWTKIVKKYKDYYRDLYKNKNE